jgi:hypothetical protein
MLEKYIFHSIHLGQHYSAHIFIKPSSINWSWQYAWCRWLKLSCGVLKYLQFFWLSYWYIYFLSDYCGSCWVIHGDRLSFFEEWVNSSIFSINVGWCIINCEEWLEYFPTGNVGNQLFSNDLPLPVSYLCSTIVRLTFANSHLMELS